MENGYFRDNVQQLLIGEPRIFARVARHREGFWHAASPVGARVAVIWGRHPLVTTVHDVMPFYMLQRHPAKYRFLRFCIEVACRGSDRIIVLFPSVRQFLMERLRVPEERITVVRWGLDPKVVGVQESREPAPGPARADTILFFGSWNPLDRGGDIAVRAMVHVLRERPHARLLLSCMGPETETLRRLARHLGVERSVDFVGFIPGEKLGETLRSATAVVFPSRLGFSLLEIAAMHAGAPVVATDVRDQSYFVGNDGLVCPPDDPSAVAVQLVRLLEDEKLRSELARRGRNKVREFSPERMVEETLQVYAAAGWVPRG
jgi:glycosyltransferase involved in cell wall biosynthesis